MNADRSRHGYAQIVALPRWAPAAGNQAQRVDYRSRAAQQTDDLASNSCRFTLRAPAVSGRRFLKDLATASTACSGTDSCVGLGILTSAIAAFRVVNTAGARTGVDGTQQHQSCDASTMRWSPGRVASAQYSAAGAVAGGDLRGCPACQSATMAAFQSLLMR